MHRYTRYSRRRLPNKSNLPLWQLGGWRGGRMFIWRCPISRSNQQKDLTTMTLAKLLSAPYLPELCPFPPACTCRTLLGFEVRPPWSMLHGVQFASPRAQLILPLATEKERGRESDIAFPWEYTDIFLEVLIQCITVIYHSQLAGAAGLILGNLVISLWKPSAHYMNH